MAVKSIVDIDFGNLDKFKAFADSYAKYEEQLARAGAAGRHRPRDRQAEEGLRGSRRRRRAWRSRPWRRVDAEQSKFRNEAEQSSTLWQRMSRNTKEVAGNIAGATSQLLRWGAITGVVSGLVGAGGLFGIDRLALGVAAGRRSSLGLGVGYGEQRAFGANFGRFVDPESFLSAVSGAQLDVTKRVGLIGAGLSGSEINGSAAEASIALIRRLKQIADTTDPALYGQVIGARRLDQFASPQDLQRLRNTSPAEIAELVARYRRDRSDFDLPPDVSRKWQEFTTQMTRAGQGIENTFVRGLAPLAPGLTHLSESFEHVVRAFMSSPTLGKWIGAVDKGLEHFANYIGTDDFGRNVRDFVTGVGQLAASTLKVARFARSHRAVGKSRRRGDAGRPARRSPRHDRAGQGQRMAQLPHGDRPRRSGRPAQHRAPVRGERRPGGLAEGRDRPLPDHARNGAAVRRSTRRGSPTRSTTKRSRRRSSRTSRGATTATRRRSSSATVARDPVPRTGSVRRGTARRFSRARPSITSTGLSTCTGLHADRGHDREHDGRERRGDRQRAEELT